MTVDPPSHALTKQRLDDKAQFIAVPLYTAAAAASTYTHSRVRREKEEPTRGLEPRPSAPLRSFANPHPRRCTAALD